jgi:poly(3-hydroxybutyrate) depolymerase
MLAATSDQMISYTPGPSAKYPEEVYPGMEATRDAWLAAMQLQGPPVVDALADTVSGDSYTPDTGLATSTVERQRYPAGANGQEIWYYKATGMGHWWPNPRQIWAGLWPNFGKTNQDIDFADEAWTFFKRHQKRPPETSL